jgi:hypothetical protein
MPYTKTTWVDANTPAIDASHLNKIEEGIRVAQLTAESATPGSTAATAVHVVTGFTFTDIQTQITAASAAGGGMVVLPEGVYTGRRANRAQGQRGDPRGWDRAQPFCVPCLVSRRA